MSSETRFMLIGFLSTPMIAVALVGVYWLAQGWKITAPYPAPFWVLPGQLASFVVFGLLIWWWRS